MATREAADTAGSRRAQHVEQQPYAGTTWRLETDTRTVTGLVTDERLATDGSAVWTLVVDPNGSTTEVSWADVDSAEEITPDCPWCAIVGASCPLHGGEADE